MLELVNVAKSYPSPGSTGGVCVLRDITLRVADGQSIVIVGPSGSGKSTLLNIIGALDRPTAGKVLFDGRDLANLGETELAGIRNREIGFVFQLHHLLPQCTVLENVLVPTLAGKGKNCHEGTKSQRNYKLKKLGVFVSWWQNMDSTLRKDSSFVVPAFVDKTTGEKALRRMEVQERAVHLLQCVGLKDHLLHRPGELSGGERQRVAVVRALINRPKLLLADEPTGSLDADASKNIAELLVELNRSEKVTLIVVTHSLVLAEYIGQVWQLSDGVLKNKR